MSLATGIELVPGSHVWFAIKGAALTITGSAIRYGGATANVVQADVKPIMNSTQTDGAWVKFGDVIKGGTKIDRGQGIKVRAPSPGRLKLKKVIYPYVEQMLEFGTQQVDRRALQLAFATLELGPSATQFNPGEGEANAEGWLRYQVLNFDGSTFLTKEAWVSLILTDGLDLDAEKLTEPKFQGTMLISPLNAGSF